jgi:hypothetical protein
MAESDDLLEWKVDFGALRPERRFIVLAIALGAGFIGLKLGGVLLSAIGFFVVLVSTAEVFLPLKYRIDSGGAQVRCGLSVTAIRWSDVKRLIRMADGVRLSPLEKPSRLDEFRGVYLRFRDNDVEVSGKIRQFWHGDSRALDGRSDGTGDGGAADESGGTGPEAKA